MPKKKRKKKLGRIRPDPKKWSEQREFRSEITGQLAHRLSVTEMLDDAGFYLGEALCELLGHHRSPAACGCDKWGKRRVREALRDHPQLDITTLTNVRKHD